MAPVWRISESTPTLALQRSRQPTMMKLAMSEEPPWLMKGSVMLGEQARDAADDDEGLQHDDGGEAHGRTS
ncbi:MAG: hypothetical protein ACLUE1_02090 [Adlercreutzia equolifaciens]